VIKQAYQATENGLSKVGYVVGYPLGIVTGMATSLLSAIPLVGAMVRGGQEGFVAGAMDWDSAYVTAMAKLERVQQEMLSSLRQDLGQRTQTHVPAQ
jgi:hypothetical protein